MTTDRIKSIADKYISADGSEPDAPQTEMSDEDYRHLEDKYLTERARRWYNKQYPKEAAFRAFCARVKRDFMDKLVPSQEETIEAVCDALPLPTLDQFLAKQREKLDLEREFNNSGYLHLANLSWDHGSYNWKKQCDFDRIWRRVRQDWGLIELDTFEHELEKASQEDPQEQEFRPSRDVILAKLGAQGQRHQRR